MQTGLFLFSDNVSRADYTSTAAQVDTGGTDTSAGGTNAKGKTRKGQKGKVQNSGGAGVAIGSGGDDTGGAVRNNDVLEVGEGYWQRKDWFFDYVEGEVIFLIHSNATAPADAREEVKKCLSEEKEKSGFGVSVEGVASADEVVTSLSLIECLLRGLRQGDVLHLCPYLVCQAKAARVVGGTCG